MSEIDLCAREQAAHSWLEHVLGRILPALTPVSGDASFRRYFRVTLDDRALILMDAPPEKENCEPFVTLARHWRAHGVHVPELVAMDLAQGFLCLEDFGDQLLWDALTNERGQPVLSAAEQQYPQAIQNLLDIQSIPADPECALPPYDHALLMQEMSLFRDWLVSRHLGIRLDANEATLFADTFEALAQSALAQPAVTVHRDYHSRNLMCLPDASLGILDFQDAVAGPITYDLVSLLRDCYIVWPEEAVYRWVALYCEQARARGIDLPDAAQFRRWFDLMGVQRHLKASGIFARLSMRDDKHGYLESIPDTVDYLRRIMPRYPETAELGEWIEQNLVAALCLEAELA